MNIVTTNLSRVKRHSQHLKEFIIVSMYNSHTRKINLSIDKAPDIMTSIFMSSE
jgi:hypothetical protein